MLEKNRGSIFSALSARVRKQPIARRRTAAQLPLLRPATSLASPNNNTARPVTAGARAVPPRPQPRPGPAKPPPACSKSRQVIYTVGSKSTAVQHFRGIKTHESLGTGQTLVILLPSSSSFSAATRASAERQSQAGRASERRDAWPEASPRQAHLRRHCSSFRRWVTTSDGAAASPLAGARAQPRVSASPSSGPASVPWVPAARLPSSSWRAEWIR